MQNIFILIMLFLFITILVMSISYLLMKKPLYDREKSSPFECGFDPINSSRIPFSIKFFLISIIFLVFDVEITLIFPMILVLKNSHIISWTFTSIIFIIILLIGLFHEWNQGALNWKN